MSSLGHTAATNYLPILSTTHTHTQYHNPEKPRTVRIDAAATKISHKTSPSGFIPRTSVKYTRDQAFFLQKSI